MSKNAKKSWRQKGWCKKNPTKLQFQSNFYTENLDALKTLRIDRSRPQNLARTSGTLWSTSSDTHQVDGIGNHLSVVLFIPKYPQS